MWGDVHASSVELAKLNMKPQERCGSDHHLRILDETLRLTGISWGVESQSRAQWKIRVFKKNKVNIDCERVLEKQKEIKSNQLLEVKKDKNLKEGPNYLLLCSKPVQVWGLKTAPVIPLCLDFCVSWIREGLGWVVLAEDLWCRWSHMVDGA